MTGNEMYVHVTVVNNEANMIEVVCFAVMSHKAY